MLAEQSIASLSLALLHPFGGGWPDAWLAFERPIALALVPILGALAALPFLLRKHALARLEWLHLSLRLAVILLAGVALADPRWTWTTNKLDVVVVRDVSESVPTRSQQALERFLATAAQPDPARHERVGQVQVASTPAIVDRPSELPLTLTSLIVPDRGSTALDAGVRLGAALQSPDAGLRVVLASDGNETSGSLLVAARDLAARRIPLDVIPLEAHRDPWALVRSFTLPQHARAGSTVQGRVDVESTRDLRGELVVRGTREFTLPVDLTAGRTTLTFPIEIGSEAVERVDVHLRPADPVDVDPRGLRATALTLVEAPSRVLLLRPGDTDTSRLERALLADEIAVDVRTPEMAPSSIEAWAAYDCVIAAGLMATDIGPARQRQLRSYVEDIGGGLLAIGGRHGFCRDWLDTPLDEALPVDLRLPESRMPSTGAVALVIDRSGSMEAMVGVSGRSQQAFASDAAISSLQTLTSLDDITVVAFDGTASAVVPLQGNRDPARIASLIRSIRPGGGTNALAGIDMAAQELERSRNTARHIVLLSDGNSSGDPGEAIRRAATLRRAGVTMSTIAIGDGADDTLMSQLAQAGGGRFHRISQGAMATSLQDVMRRETESVRRAPIREGELFSIAVVNSDGPLRSTTAMPGITGYGVVAERDRRAEVGARGPEGDPILAYWNHGLGRVIAFTGDPFGPWAGGWPTWNASRDGQPAGAEDAFWRTAIRWTSRAPLDPGAKLAVVETHGGRSTHQIVLTLSDADGTPRSHGIATARVSLDGQRDNGSREIPLEPDGLGRFVAPLDLDRDTLGLVTAGFATTTGDGATPLTGRARAPIVHRGSSEWERSESDDALLRRAAQATGGVSHIVANPGSIFLRDGVRFPTWSHAVWQVFGILAALTFVLDVACRRLILPTKDRVLQAVTAPFVPVNEPDAPRHPAPTPPSEPTTAATISRDLDQRLARLQHAKRRASERNG